MRVVAEQRLRTSGSRPPQRPAGADRPRSSTIGTTAPRRHRRSFASGGCRPPRPGPVLGKSPQPRPMSLKRQSISSSLLRSNSRTCRLSAKASLQYSPCFHFAMRQRASPSAVRGPVLLPPCIRQRPFAIPGAAHRVPRRVFAPQRGAVLGSPAGFPFLSQPRRFAGGSSTVCLLTPGPPSPAAPTPRPRRPGRLSVRGRARR